MNRKTKFLIPTFAAVFALVFVFVTPYVMAEGDYEGHSKWGAKHQGMNKAVTVDGFMGSIPIPEDFDKETMKANLEKAIHELRPGAGGLGTSVSEGCGGLGTAN